MTSLADRPELTDDLQLERFLAPLVDRAIRRQSWFFFLDEDSVPVGPVMPFDQHPARPDEPTPTSDLGVRPWAEVIAARFGEIMRELAFAQIVIVWERPGGPRVEESDRSWAAAFDAAFRAVGAGVRAQFLLHDKGLRILAPDDLVDSGAAQTPSGIVG